MNEIPTPAALGKTVIGGAEGAAREAAQAAVAGWTRLLSVRFLAGAALLFCCMGVALEASSSYVLYRHYSRLHQTFSPAGSATIALVRAVKAHAEGRHDPVELSIDKGPLFRSDGYLGYAMYPGSYHITEKHGGLSHRFSLTVDDLGHRITSRQPNPGLRRIFIAGDSLLFGWGLDDEQTLGWLLQTRFPQFQVVNLSLNSYSTVHAKLQLDQARPDVTADDIVVLNYHPVTNDFNVASDEMIAYLKYGFEQQLGEPDLLQNLALPYGILDATGALSIRYFPINCALRTDAAGRCQHPASSAELSKKITIRLFDALMDAHPSHFMVAFSSGKDADPVIAHLRARGVTVVDLRNNPGDPDAEDVVATDAHAGPFWHFNSYERLTAALRQAPFAR